MPGNPSISCRTQRVCPARMWAIEVRRAKFLWSWHSDREEKFPGLWAAEQVEPQMRLPFWFRSFATFRRRVPDSKSRPLEASHLPEGQSVAFRCLFHSHLDPGKPTVLSPRRRRSGSRLRFHTSEKTRHLSPSPEKSRRPVARACKERPVPTRPGRFAAGSPSERRWLQARKHGGLDERRGRRCFSWREVCRLPSIHGGDRFVTEFRNFFSQRCQPSKTRLSPPRAGR